MLKMSLMIYMLVFANITHAQSSQSSRLVIVSPPTTSAAKSSSMSSKSSVAASVSSVASVSSKVSSSVSSSSMSIPAGTPVVSFYVEWVPPVVRANGMVMTIEETGGYLLEWKLDTDKEWYSLRLESNIPRSYTFVDMPDLKWQFRIRSFDTHMLYSEAIILDGKKYTVAKVNSRPKLSEFKACIPGGN